MQIFRHVQSATIIVILGAVASFGANVLLGRTLTTEHFGHFSLIRSVLFFLPTFVFLGFGHALVRISKNENIFQLDWKQSVRKMEKLSFSIVLILILLIRLFYPFSLVESIAVGVAAWLLSRIWITNALLRLKKRFVLGQFIPLAWRFIFLLGLVSVMIWIELSIEIALFVFFGSFAFAFVINTFFERNIPSGEKPIKLSKIISSGGFFFLISAVTLLMTQMDKFMISATLGTEQVGIYVGVSLVSLTVFNLVGSTIGYILMPHLANNNRLGKWETAFYFLLIPTFILVLMLYGGDLANDILFKSKFSGHDGLLNLAITLGLLQYFHNLITFTIGGLANAGEMKMFFVIVALSFVLLGIVSYWGSQSGSLFNLVFGVVFAWSLRNVGGGILLAKIYFCRKGVIKI